MTIIPLHPDPEDPQDYSAITSELMPVRIFDTFDLKAGRSTGKWYWRIDHPLMDHQPSVGPYSSAEEAYESMMQYPKLQAEPAGMPDLTQGKVAMGALEETLEGLPRK